MQPTRTLNGFWRASTGGLIFIALYCAAVGTWMLVSALQPDAGPWDFWGFIILGFYVVPALIIPVFLVRAFRQKRCIRLGKLLPWLLRGVCLSVIFAMCDSWWATGHTNTLFSATTWATRDGGTRGYVGFGYCLTYYRSLSGERGPAVWFWYTPFVIDTAHRGVQVRWLWSQ